MNKFVFVAPAYNASKTVDRMLKSVFLQTYKNWKILISDDMSTDGTVEVISEVCEDSGILYLIRRDGETGWGTGNTINSQVIVDVRTTKFWEVKNVLSMIRDPILQEDDVICRIDSDDFLNDLHSLDVINQAYNETGCEILWTKHSWNLDERKNVSKPLPLGTSGKDIYKLCKAGWWGPSHLKTFRKHLLSDVKEENYFGPDGKTYARRAGDRYIILPAAWTAGTKWCFLDRFTYHYSINDVPETYMSDDAKFQKMESDYLSERGFLT